jgi:hypothetical protein
MGYRQRISAFPVIELRMILLGLLLERPKATAAFGVPVSDVSHLI